MSTGNDELFESMMEDFEAIEKDPNKNVDETELNETDIVQLYQDYRKDLNEPYDVVLKIAVEGDYEPEDVLDALRLKGILRAKTMADLKADLPASDESKVDEDEVKEEKERCPECGNAIEDGECTQCDWSAGNESKTNEDEVEEKPEEEEESVSPEDTDEKKKTPTCDKCNKAHWPFQKCKESSEGEGEQEEVKEEVVEEQLVPRSDDLLFIDKSAFDDTWQLISTREGSNTATVIFTFVSDGAAHAAGQKIADAIGGEYRGKEDPGKPEGRQRTEAKVKALEDIWKPNVSDITPLQNVDEQHDPGMPKEVLQELLAAWEIIGSQDDDPHVRTMADRKVEEIERALSIGQPDPDSREEEPDLQRPDRFSMDTEESKVDEEEVKEEKINEDIGGDVIGPIELDPEEFTILADTLDRFVDIAPELEEFAGQAFVTLIVTDGSRYIGIDPQGFDYPRYKTSVFDSAEEVEEAAGESSNWHRKYVPDK